MRIMFDTDNGPAVTVITVNPPLAPHEVEISFEDLIPSRTKTPTMDRNLLAALIGECR